MKTKTISLGDIRIESYKKGDRLFPDYYYEDTEDIGDRKQYQKEIKDSPPDEVILLPNQEYELKISYPLTYPFITKLKSNVKGLTRRDVVNFVVKCYKQIYKKEDERTNVKVGKIPGMYNRNRTDGKYGIWGHDLSDLILCSLQINGNKLTVGVDS